MPEIESWIVEDMKRQGVESLRYDNSVPAYVTFILAGEESYTRYNYYMVADWKEPRPRVDPRTPALMQASTLDRKNYYGQFNNVWSLRYTQIAKYFMNASTNRSYRL